jgi:hypothetical protein
MLMVNEKDRLSWDGVFNDPTIKIDEERIKKNMEVIMKEKGTSSSFTGRRNLEIDIPEQALHRAEPSCRLPGQQPNQHHGFIRQ